MSDIETKWRDEIATAIKRAYGLGQLYWQQADSESYRENAKSDVTRAKFAELLEQSVCKLQEADTTIAAKDAEIARLREANRYLVGISNEAMDDARKYAEAQREIARLREALTHIAEYWNRSENDTAMNDALFHMIETAEAALAQESGE